MTDFIRSSIYYKKKQTRSITRHVDKYHNMIQNFQDLMDQNPKIENSEAFCDIDMPVYTARLLLFVIECNFLIMVTVFSW
jgi:hypothetical protein